MRKLFRSCIGLTFAIAALFIATIILAPEQSPPRHQMFDAMRELLIKTAKAQGFILQNNTLVFGHLAAGASLPPTVAGASCGTPVLTAGSTDFVGQFQAKGTSTCALTFGTAYTAAPFCVVVDETTASTYTYTRTAITMGTTVSNDFVNYICVATTGN